MEEEPVCTVSGNRQNNRESVDNHSGWPSTSGQKIEETNMPPIQGEIKWEMAQTRTSKRNR